MSNICKWFLINKLLTKYFAVTYPDITAMQTRAVIRATINVKKAHADWNIVHEIMIPLVGEVKELKYDKIVVLNKMFCGILFCLPLF